MRVNYGKLNKCKEKEINEERKVVTEEGRRGEEEGRQINSIEGKNGD